MVQAYHDLRAKLDQADVSAGLDPWRRKSVVALTGLCGVPSATDFRCQGAQVITRYRSCVPIKEGSRNGRQRLVEVGLQQRAGLVLEPTIERLLALGE